MRKQISAMEIVILAAMALVALIVVYAAGPPAKAGRRRFYRGFCLTVASEIPILGVPGSGKRLTKPLYDKPDGGAPSPACRNHASLCR